MFANMVIHQVLDCRGLSGPMPILKVEQSLSGLQIGQVLEIIASDPASVNQMEAFARSTGYWLIDSTRNSGSYVFRIQRNR